MNPFYQDKDRTVYAGDNRLVLPCLPSDFYDSCVTDPPYFLTNDAGNGFMGKSWDSLSPKGALVDAIFRSLRLVSNTDEESTVLPPASTQLSERKVRQTSTARSVAKPFIEQSQRSNQSMASVPANAITRDEVLALCAELSPLHTSALLSLPTTARFAVSPLFTGSKSKSIARNVAAILLDDPVWLEQITTFTSTDKTERNSTGAANGSSSENKSTSATVGDVVNAESIADEKTSSVITSSHIRFQEITEKLTSLPSVRPAIRQCIADPTFIPILSEVFHLRWAREIYRVLKPGAYLLAFGGTRSAHRMASAIEDAGFEIRDSILWLYGTGFPKSKNIGNGKGTALKPAHEPIVVARKPLAEKSVEANVIEYGTGALNIDACKIASPDPIPVFQSNKSDRWIDREGVKIERTGESHTAGRWPANLILDEFTASLLDEQSGQLTSGTGAVKRASAAGYQANAYGKESRAAGTPCLQYGDTGGASRFFYVAKPSPAERNEGLEDRASASVNDGRKTSIDNAYQRGDTPRQNIHPTVKPVELMRYLVKLITPEGGTVIDPFMGSGTTGIACELEGRSFVGIELDETYCEIAVKRMMARCAGLFAPSSY